MEELELTIESVVFQSDDGKFSVFRGRGLRKEKISVVYKGFAPFPANR
jgi:exodeoxyribonuclease V alpha subunit